MTSCSKSIQMNTWDLVKGYLISPDRSVSIHLTKRLGGTNHQYCSPLSLSPTVQRQRLWAFVNMQKKKKKRFKLTH